MMDGCVDEKQKETQTRHACLLACLLHTMRLCVVVARWGGKDRISPSQLRGG